MAFYSAGPLSPGYNSTSAWGGNDNADEDPWAAPGASSSSTPAAAPASGSAGGFTSFSTQHQQQSNRAQGGFGANSYFGASLAQEADAYGDGAMDAGFGSAAQPGPRMQRADSGFGAAQNQHSNAQSSPSTYGSAISSIDQAPTQRAPTDQQQRQPTSPTAPTPSNSAFPSGVQVGANQTSGASRFQSHTPSTLLPNEPAGFSSAAAGEYGAAPRQLAPGYPLPASNYTIQLIRHLRGWIRSAPRVERRSRTCTAYPKTFSRSRFAIRSRTAWVARCIPTTRSLPAPTSRHSS